MRSVDENVRYENDADDDYGDVEQSGQQRRVGSGGSSWVVETRGQRPASWRQQVIDRPTDLESLIREMSVLSPIGFRSGLGSLNCIKAPARDERRRLNHFAPSSYSLLQKNFGAYYFRRSASHKWFEWSAQGTQTRNLRFGFRIQHRNNLSNRNVSTFD